jgi:hypothetical protein
LGVGDSLVKIAESRFGRGNGFSAAASAGGAMVTVRLFVNGPFHFRPREIEILVELPPYPR